VQAPPVVVPKLKTFAGGSGITGTQGDLTLVLDEFAFLAPFGDGCTAGASDPIKLDSPFPPELDFSEYVLETTNAPTITGRNCRSSRWTPSVRRNSILKCCMSGV